MAPPNRTGPGGSSRDAQRSRFRIAAVALSLLALLASSSAVAQVPVRIVTWNIESVGAPGSNEYLAALATLRRLDADVVGVNEINGAADVSYFNALAAEAGYAGAVTPGPTAASTLSNGILSRLPILRHTVHTSLALSGGGIANDISRLIVEVVVDVPGDAEDLFVVVQHWQSGVSNADEFRRAVDSMRVAQTISGRDSTTDAVVVMGDVNDEIDAVPNTPDPFTVMPTGLPSSFALGIDLAFVVIGPGIRNDPFFYLVTPATPALTALPALRLDGDDATRPASGRRLDYIFVSEALDAFHPEPEVYDSADEGLPGGLQKTGAALEPSTSAAASDHLPVFADLMVPAASTPPTETPTATATASATPRATATATLSPSSPPSPTSTGTRTPSRTSTPSRTATLASTSTPTRTVTGTPTPSGTPTHTPTPSAPPTRPSPPTPTTTAPCAGDCDRDGVVTVDEIVALVNIGLGTGDIAACPSADANADGAVTVDEILAGVNAALRGCSGEDPEPTPFPTSTRTPAATSVPPRTATRTPTPTWHRTVSPTPSATPYPPQDPTPPRPPVCRDASTCCRVCVRGKACGDTCIAADFTCHVGRGCACNSSELCRIRGL